MLIRRSYMNPYINMQNFNVGDFCLLYIITNQFMEYFLLNKI